MENKIIVRYADGKIKKGTTENFLPNKKSFYLIDKDNGETQEINILDLKALFFIKSFEGESSYVERKDIERVGLGRKIKVNFKDGEELVGYTQGFSKERAGFLLFPVDPDSNNEKVFIVAAATDKISWL